MNFAIKFIVAMCLFAHQVYSTQWVVGYSAESCTTTCQKASPAKTCSLTALQAITTREAFDAAVTGATQLGKAELAGTSTDYCTAGVNSWPFATAPAIMQYPLYVKGTDVDAHEHGEYILQNSCFFPTTGVEGGCDATFNVPAVQRLCPCE